MDNLTKIIREYKETKSSKLLNDLFLMLDKIIQDKAKYVYYQQKFYIDNRRTTLAKSNKIEIEDIIQELRLEVLRIINNYDISKEFSPYFYATLWKWTPEMFRRKSLKLINESDLIKEGEENTGLIDNTESESKYFTEEVNLDEMFKNLDKDEKKLLKLMTKYPDKNQTQLANMLRVTQQRVSQMIENIRNKYKFNL